MAKAVLHLSLRVTRLAGKQKPDKTGGVPFAGAGREDK